VQACRFQASPFDHLATKEKGGPMKPAFRNIQGQAAMTACAAIRVARRYDAPAAQVFAAWLDPALARHWLFATASRPMQHGEIVSRVGGRYRFVEDRDGTAVEHGGEYAAIVPARRLVFTLESPDVPETVTRVRADFAPAAAGCVVTVSHTGLPACRARQARARWTGILYGLGVTLGVRHGAARAAQPLFAPRISTERSHAIPADVLFR
jgi:uncharacterized protein YndB with AHSA1/START domain